MSQWSSQYFLLVLLACSFVVTFFIFKPFLAPLVLATAFAVALQPVYRSMLRHVGNWPSVASLGTVLLAVIFILTPLIFVGTQIGIEAAGLYASLGDGGGRAEIFSTVQTLEDKVARYIPGATGRSAHISEDISLYAQQGLRWVALNLGIVFSSILSLFLSLFIFFITLYYLLRDGLKFKQAIIALSPLRDTYDERIFDRLELAVNSVIKGNLVMVLIHGGLAYIAFSFFGVPNSLLWATVAAIAGLIPGIGTALVFVPVVLFTLATGNGFGALGLTIWGTLVVGAVDNFLAPGIVGRGIKLHPLLVLLSVLGGITFFGPIGIFLGPLSLSLLFAFLSIYSDIERGSGSLA